MGTAAAPALVVRGELVRQVANVLEEQRGEEAERVARRSQRGQRLAQVPEVEVDKNLGLSILAAIAGSGIVYFTLPGVGLMIFGDYAAGAGCLVGAAGCAVVVGVLMKKIGWQNVI